MSSLFSTEILRNFIENWICCSILCRRKPLMMRNSFRILILVCHLTLINNCNSIAIYLWLWSTLTVFLFVLKVLIIGLKLQCPKCILNCWIMIIDWFCRKVIDQTYFFLLIVILLNLGKLRIIRWVKVDLFLIVLIPLSRTCCMVLLLNRWVARTSLGSI